MILKKDVFDAIIDWSNVCSPEEACGLLIGETDPISGVMTASSFVKIENVDHSPKHFTMDASTQLAAQKNARRTGKRVVATFHSHPVGPQRMTREDVRLAVDQEMVWIIVAHLNTTEFSVKSYRIIDGSPVPEHLEVIS